MSRANGSTVARLPERLLAAAVAAASSRSTSSSASTVWAMRCSQARPILRPAPVATPTDLMEPPPRADLCRARVSEVTARVEERSRGDVTGVRIGGIRGPERGCYATRVECVIAKAHWAGQAGRDGVGLPQPLPNP